MAGGLEYMTEVEHDVRMLGFQVPLEHSSLLRDQFVVTSNAMQMKISNNCQGRLNDSIVANMRMQILYLLGRKCFFSMTKP